MFQKNPEHENNVPIKSRTWVQHHLTKCWVSVYEDETAESEEAFGTSKWFLDRLRVHGDKGKEFENVSVLSTLDRKDMDAFTLMEADEKAVRDVSFLLRVISVLESFNQKLIDKNKEVTDQDLSLVHSTIVKLVFFTMETTSTDPFDCKGIYVANRQRYLRELKVKMKFQRVFLSIRLWTWFSQ